MAVGASLVPWVLLATTKSGGSYLPLPLARLASSFPGISKRDFIALDVFVIGALPLLTGVVATAGSHIPVGAVSGLFGVLTLLHLVPVLSALPVTIPPADATPDTLAGSQPDFYFGTHPEGGFWALAPIAYAVSTAALLIAARWEGRGVTRDD
ncbi:hypothetical protein Psi01_12780 [Planobispora siamensis]|uniref:Uncharacterized protein n=1 Tax=Planobispora siamensis TaxID=936338 RepID=A0A8J3WIK0_9ACTN|nr:hypothetical protein Psi01_12780 [Planobispora siamensis]